MKLGAQEADNSLYKLIDNANALIFYLDMNGNISVFNKKLANMTGRQKENVIGKHWASVLCPENGPFINQHMFKAVIDDSIAYKRSNSFEGGIVDTGKNERFISWNITPILSESEEPEGILFIGNDVTESKEKEAALKKIDDTLKDILVSIKEYALYVINLNGNITYYGMGSELMFGWQKNDIIFKHAGIFTAKESAETSLPFILEQVRQHGLYELEMNLIRKDGQLFPATVTVSQLRDAEGKLIGYIFIAKDITERKKLEYQIFQTEKLAAIGQLAAGMAHEVNNPLFVMSGRMEIILARKRLAKKLAAELNIINSQIERIRQLVDRLLQFARKRPPELQSININELIDSVLPFLDYHKSPEARIDIERDVSGNLHFIKGDLNQLQEVFVNLLINAHQAMPEGGTVTIKTSNYMDKFAEVRISDTGVGIAENKLKDVFMPFFSTKKNGTGLGLSICHNIIKSHNGSIDVESKIGKGTTFTIRLPFSQTS